MPFGIPPPFQFGIDTDVVEERPVAHGIDRVDVPPPHLFVAAVPPTRFVMFADYTAHQVDSPQCVLVESHVKKAN